MIGLTIVQCQNNGLKKIQDTSYRLKRLARNCNLLDPENVKAYIATAQTEPTKAHPTQRPISDTSKNRYAYVYDLFCKANQIQWKKPYYKVAEKAPLIPTSENVRAPYSKNQFHQILRMWHSVRPAMRVIIEDKTLPPAPAAAFLLTHLA